MLNILSNPGLIENNFDDSGIMPLADENLSNIQFLDNNSFIPSKISATSEVIEPIDTDLLSSSTLTITATETATKSKILTHIKIIIACACFAQFFAWANFGLHIAIGYQPNFIEPIVDSLTIWIGTLISSIIFIIYQKNNHQNTKHILDDEQKKIIKKNQLILQERLNNNKLLKQHKALIYSHLSHSILNPLQVCLFGFDVINAMVINNDITIEQQQAIKDANFSIKKIEFVINKLLALQKLESTENTSEQSHQESFTLNHLMSMVASNLCTKAANKNLKVTCEANISFESKLNGHLDYLNQVLEILINNAIKFTNIGFVKIIIRKEREMDNNLIQLHFAVRDSGIGIPPNKLNIIFNPYPATETDNEDPLSPNAGLGLSIAYELIMQMNNNFPIKKPLGVFSSVGARSGTTFWFRILLEKYKTTKNSTFSMFSQENNLINQQYKTYNLNILLVEDCRSNQIIMHNILTKQLGCTTTIVHNGKQAIDAVTKNVHEFDAVFMDIEMPIMNGLEATMILKTKLHVTCPIIACTANTSQEDISSCLEAGMDDYILKPINPNKINKILANFFDNDLTRQRRNTQNQLMQQTTPMQNVSNNHELLFTFNFIANNIDNQILAKSTVLESYVGEVESAPKTPDSYENNCSNSRGYPRSP